MFDDVRPGDEHPVRTLIMARHGESTASRDEWVNGDPTALVDLTDHGRSQAGRLGDALKERRLDVCVTSSFLRTRRTADIALSGRSIPHVIDSDLDDIRFGALEGVALNQYRSWLSEHGIYTAPQGGESRVTTIRRFLRALKRIAARTEDHVLAITHGLTIAYVVAAIDGLDLDGQLAPPGHAEPVTFTRDGLLVALRGLEAWMERTA